MKIRLQILTAPGETCLFEHCGPTVRIGRDPQGELVFQGKMSQAVSWNHAKVELRSSGAFVQDLGSSNGTFVNDRRIAEPVALQVRDQIQLGHTGPTLKVLELDLSPMSDHRSRSTSAANVAGVPPPEPPPVREVKWRDELGQQTHRALPDYTPRDESPPPRDPAQQVPPQVVVVQTPGYDPPVRRDRGYKGFECPYCHTDAYPIVRSRISTAGWVVFVVLLIFCFPFCIIGLFIKEDYRVCSACGIRLG